MDSLYQYDYERGDWQAEKNRFIKDVLIHTGILEMYKDKRHNEFGNIGIRSLNRYTDIVYDGFWSTDNIDDCRYIMKNTWLTAREIKSMYQTSSQQIDDSIIAYEQIEGMEDFAFDREQLASRGEDFYDSTNNRFRIIEVVYMQQVNKTKANEKVITRHIKKANRI
jgi:hypothetical protein